jgi:hypothetical protein
MTKQWTLVVRWSDETRSGNVHFWWDGTRGRQLDYHTESKNPRMGIPAVYEVDFPGTDTFNGFVKWALDCAEDLPNYEFILPTGCPECGGILSARVADCDGVWHADNKSSALRLSEYMDVHYPRAVAYYQGDQFLAALEFVTSLESIRQWINPSV